jgi:membrane-associated PAP2 superfamily phosphatase
LPINRVLAALILALIFVGLLFGLWPQLDLAATRWVYQNFGFLGASEVARDARDSLRVAPILLLVALAALWLARRLGWARLSAPSSRAMVFLIASLTIGSGLIVNLGLKDHSHRPRPVHVREFGGEEAFRPWYRFDGACRKNCAFASGEAASGFWMLAPALLAPPPLRAAAIAAAIFFGVATSALRVAFGGHFLSDVLFGGLISAIVVMGLWRVFARGAAVAFPVESPPAWWRRVREGSSPPPRPSPVKGEGDSR